MKISVEDGIVVCSLEDRVEGFLTGMGVYGCFKGLHNGKMRIHIPFYDGKSLRTILNDEYEIKVINKIIVNANYFGVEVDEAVYERLNCLRNKLADERRLAQERLEEQKRIKNWNDKCINGCGQCKYKRRDGDDQLCAASGDLLEEKLKPKYINGLHYMFNYEAFPSENCVYKIN